MTELVQKLLNGNQRALARLLTHIENESKEATAALAALYPFTGRAHIVGITGAPGTGKSSLVTSLAKGLRAADKTVGIVAVDPTSPFSGGAVLGDRIRMRDLSGDRGVFIRSMATRGSLGGLARATGNATRALDAAGYDVILIETVGAGQSEVDIARQAHTTIVVEAPGMGDDIQAIKAGILEIADILVVNKADRPEAAKTVRALQAMLELGHGRQGGKWHHHGQLLLKAPASKPDQANSPATDWTVPIIQTVATDTTGIAEVITAITHHRAFLDSSGQREAGEWQRLQTELASRLQEALLAQLLAHTSADTIKALLERLAAREIDPNMAVRELLGTFNGQPPHQSI